MKPDEIQLSDWMRILVGEVPASFYIEAVLRIVFIYLLLLFAMRQMGSRMGSMLTRNEMTALVSLAAANGVALMAPDRGLLPVVVIAAVIIGYQRLIAWWAFRNKKFESLVLDDVRVLVEDGRLLLKNLEDSVLSREQLMARLRQESISNLGSVQRVYQEANGAFSILKYPKPKPGLSILPLGDAAFRQEQEKAPGQFACGSCAHLVPGQQLPARECPSCGEKEWYPAVLG
ncbi:MAG TPA: YetF domain-containing protein [Hymenobacter sp.]